MLPRIFCFVSDKHLWSLQPYSYLMSKYWPSAKIVFAGYSAPDFELPGPFVSMGNFGDYPASRWSDGVLGFLNAADDEYFILMLEDYYLTRHVNEKQVIMLAEYMRSNASIGRLDLATDRLYGSNPTDVDTVGSLDIIENIPPAHYHLSLQASIWRRSDFIGLMRNGESAWELEINGSKRMVDAGMRAVGTRQCPVRYLIGIQQGKLALDGGYQIPKPFMSADDKKVIADFYAKTH